MEDKFESTEVLSNRSEPLLSTQILPENYLSAQTRLRRPTEKGLQYQIELKQKSLASKKNEATKHMREVLLKFSK